MKQLRKAIAALVLVTLVASCVSKKAALVDPSAGSGTIATTPKGTPGAGAAGTASGAASTAATAAAAYVKKVNDAQVYARNIVSDLSFNLKSGSRDITVPGSLHMRRDEVIRLQLFIPLLGTEVGRLEFTPDRVLVVDRMHKEYIDADYTQLDFLKKNGLNFYSLQALFWNQLLVPGQKAVTDADLTRFDVGDGQGSSKPLKLQQGNMTYNWTTQAQTGQIIMTNVSYASAGSGASSLLWMYSNFRPLGTQLFPAHQEFQFSTSATRQLQNVKVTLDLDNPRDKSDWEPKTTVSSKYKRVEASDVLGKLLKF